MVVSLLHFSKSYVVINTCEQGSNNMVTFPKTALYVYVKNEGVECSILKQKVSLVMYIFVIAEIVSK